MYVDLDQDPLPQNEDPFRRLREEDPAWYKVQENKDGSRKIIIKHSNIPGK